MRWMITAFMGLVGVAAGLGAGFVFAPKPPPACSGPACAAPADAVAEEAGKTDAGEKSDFDYVKLTNQFVIPDMEDGAIVSLVVLSLGVEVAKGQGQIAYGKEPKLRDAFLQTLFDYANVGGFRGEFTDAGRLDDLRRSLLDAARATLGETASGVLISEIMRQDMG